MCLMCGRPPCCGPWARHGISGDANFLPLRGVKFLQALVLASVVACDIYHGRLWARTLCRSAPSAPRADVSAPRADDSEDEWIRTLCRSPSGVRLASQGEPNPSASSSGTPLSPVVGEPSATASSSNPPVLPLLLPLADLGGGRCHRRPVLDCRDLKQRKLPLLRPPTVVEIHSLVHQHTQTMVLVGSDRRIQHSLMRSWISCSDKDLKTSSLEALADSLTARVRGLFCDTTPPSVFKIGLTRDPRWRFYDAPFAYSAGGEFDSMVVLLVGFVALVQWLEAALISRLRDTPGCRNVAPGGESPPPASYPCYLYVVAKPVERVMADQLRIARFVQKWHHYNALLPECSTSGKLFSMASSHRCFLSVWLSARGRWSGTYWNHWFSSRKPPCCGPWARHGIRRG